MNIVHFNLSLGCTKFKMGRGVGMDFLDIGVILSCTHVNHCLLIINIIPMLY